MTQLQRVCTPSSCLTMIAYLTSALKNVRDLEQFLHSVAAQANTLFPRYIYIIKVSSKVLNVHIRVQIFRRENHSFHYLSERRWVLNSPGNLASQFKYLIQVTESWHRLLLQIYLTISNKLKIELVSCVLCAVLFPPFQNKVVERVFFRIFQK